MKRRRRITLLTGLLLLAASFSALASEGAGQAVPWVNWGLGAEAIALGRSVLTIDGEGSGAALNPAGLSWTGNNYLTLMHTEQIEEISYNFAGIAQQYQGFGLGFAYQQIFSPNIVRYNEDGMIVGFFDYSGHTVTLAAGTKIHANAALGSSLHLIREDLGDEIANGYGLSLGLKWQAGRNLIVGALVNNPVGKVYWNTGAVETLPLTARVGALYYWPDVDLQVMGEYLHDRGDTPFHFGVEKGYQKTLRLRAGLDGLTPTLGIGLVMARLTVDYAFVLDEVFGKRQYLALNWAY